jgi:hypothetical protein
MNQSSKAEPAPERAGKWRHTRKNVHNGTQSTVFSHLACAGWDYFGEPSKWAALWQKGAADHSAAPIRGMHGQVAVHSALKRVRSRSDLLERLNSKAALEHMRGYGSAGAYMHAWEPFVRRRACTRGSLLPEGPAKRAPSPRAGR